MTGCVFSIEEFSVYDGPGIRTSVFLKGCPLRCSWCHNPEGQMCNSEIVRSPNGCIGCGLCEKYASVSDSGISFTQKSIQACPRNLLRVCGEEYTSEELCSKLLKNKRILSNGGGVTFSGGEPLFQSDFLLECLCRLEGQLHRAVQTSGFCNENVFRNVLENTDYFLFDLKLADEKEHVKYTGISNIEIHRNFAILASSKKDFTVRIPLIPTVTDTEENIEGLCKIMKDNSVNYAELLPYNKMAGGKYKMTGREYNPCFDESTPVNTRKEIFDSFGIKTLCL